MEATILSVNPNHKEWKGDKGTLSIIEGQLRDRDGEARWSVMTKPENEQTVRGVLSGLIGKPGEFVTEPKADYQGMRQVKLKEWPGQQKPGGFGGGGFKGGPPRFRDTEEGFRTEQRSIHRSVALTQAVAFHGAGNADDVINTATKFLAFLSADSAPAGMPSKAPAFDADKAAVAALAMLDPVADRGLDALKDAWKKVPEQVRNAILNTPKYCHAWEQFKRAASNVMPE